MLIEDMPEEWVTYFGYDRPLAGVLVPRCDHCDWEGQIALYTDKDGWKQLGKGQLYEHMRVGHGWPETDLIWHNRFRWVGPLEGAVAQVA